MMVHRGKLLVCTGIGLGCLSLILFAFLAGGVNGISLIVSLVVLGMSLAYVLGHLSAYPASSNPRPVPAEYSLDEFLKSLVSNTDQPQLIVDTKGILRAINREAAACLAVSPHQHIGSPFEELLPQFSEPILNFMDQFRIGSGLTSGIVEGEVAGVPGQARLRIIQNDRTGHVWVCITLRIESLADDSLDMLGRFSAGVAHDLNNLLSSIVGSVGMISRLLDGKVNEREQKLLGAIELASRRGSLLANDLMEFGKSSSAPREGRPVQLAPVVRQAVESLSGVQGADTCTLTTSVSDDLWVLATDQGVHQILMNLLFNAVDALPAGGDILIVAGAVDKSKIWLEVSDTGIGMSGEVTKRVFEPFFSTKKQQKEVRYLGGSGLGLANVRGLLAAWGGTISVTSLENEGTTFRMEFRASRIGSEAIVLH